MDDSDVIRNPQRQGFEPGFYLFVKTQQPVRLVPLEPCSEAFPALLLEHKMWQPLFQWKLILTGPEPSAEAVVHEIVNFLVNHQAGSFVAERDYFLKGLES